MTSSRALACSLILALAACGGGGGPGTGPSTMPPEPTYSVNTVVFYDENGNGVLDGAEAVRLQQVDVVVGGVSAKSGAGGQAVVAGVKAGSQTVAIRTESLPPFFVPTVPLPVQVPQAGGEVRLPVRLPIGENFPNVYLAFGDSLTVGDGSSDENGYRLKLQSRLAGALGRAQVINGGKSGTDSKVGAARIPGKTGLANQPAYTLILYGTNDWNDQSCQSSPPADCFTLDMLRTMVDEVKDRESIPVLATLPPVNPAVNPGRNVWHDQMNELIKAPRPIGGGDPRRPQRGIQGPGQPPLPLQRGPERRASQRRRLRRHGRRLLQGHHGGPLAFRFVAAAAPLPGRARAFLGPPTDLSAIPGQPTVLS